MKLINKLFKWVGKQYATVKEFLTLNKTDKQLERAINIVSKIKQYADSPIALIIVKATPFDWDDKAKQALSTFLGLVLAKYSTLKSRKALKEIAGNVAQKETGLPLEVATVKVEEAYQASKLYI